MPGTICALHGVVADTDLAWSAECGQIHIHAGDPGHTLSGEPCYKSSPPSTIPGVTRVRNEVDEFKDVTMGVRGPMSGGGDL